MPDDDWETRLADLWASADDLPEDGFIAAVDGLTAELPPDDGVAAFERAAARDASDRPGLAVPLYRQALALGLPGERRRRAVIQLASSLRNLGAAEESAALLEAERSRGSDHLDDAVAAFLALSLADLGRLREGLALVLGALGPHLPRYQRSTAEYARLLVEEAPEPA